jgi:DME family drug/metabolite transporter
MTSPAVRSRLLLAAAALLFSTGGAAIKGATLTGWQVASFRSAIAAAVLYLALPEARRGWSWRIAPPAAAYAATLLTFVLATRLTTAANAIYLQSTAPLYLLLLGPLLLREPIRRSDIFYILAIAAGMALLFVGTQPAVATAPDPPRGNAIATASGLAYALTLAGFRWLSRRQSDNPALAATVLGNLMAFVAALPMALPVTSMSPANLAGLLYLGVIQIGLAYFCLTRAMRHVTAFEANTVLLLEPAMNPVWVWLVHGETPGGWALAGGGLILAATLVTTWMQSRALSVSS